MQTCCGGGGLQSRYKIRVVSARAYHCLFMHNMLIRPTEEELKSFGRPDFTIFNAGAFPCNRYTSFMTSSSSVDINLKVCIVGLLWSMRLLHRLQIPHLCTPYNVCTIWLIFCGMRAALFSECCTVIKGFDSVSDRLRGTVCSQRSC